MFFELLREDFEALMNSLEEGVFISDKDRNILFFNNSAGRILGYEPEKVIGKKCNEIMETNLCDSKCSIIESLSSGNQIIRPMIQLKKSDGKICYCRGRTTVFKSKGGRLGIIHFFSDITELVTIRGQLSRISPWENFITRSRKMRDTFSILPELAKSDASVLIMGETGTGKELLAKDIHFQSARREAPFVHVDCYAWTENLMECELFGNVAGAYTDSKKARQGRIEMAESGTIFLDEIGDMPLAMQAKLLRVLQDKVYEPLGTSESRIANVRFISATNSDIPMLVKEGKFREDLFYRINTVVIRIPPLRERPEDIPLLVLHFLDKFNGTFGKNIRSVNKRVMDSFMDAPWYGNVRQLEHVIEHAYIISHGDEIGFEDLPQDLLSDFCTIRRTEPSLFGGLKNLQMYKREIILDCLKKHNWNKISVCKELAISRATLWRKMKDFQISFETPPVSKLKLNKIENTFKK